MGIGTVRRAKELLAWGGKSKAEILKDTIEGENSSKVPATYLQEHNNTTLF
jgi:glucosamine-6-phosphate deaminase